MNKKQFRRRDLVNLTRMSGSSRVAITEQNGRKARNIGAISSDSPYVTISLIIVEA